LNLITAIKVLHVNTILSKQRFVKKNISHSCFYFLVMEGTKIKRLPVNLAQIDVLSLKYMSS
jgi:hypothetical protein